VEEGEEEEGKGQYKKKVTSLGKFLLSFTIKLLSSKATLILKPFRTLQSLRLKCPGYPWVREAKIGMEFTPWGILWYTNLCRDQRSIISQ
jgi:hypothetical protein